MANIRVNSTIKCPKCKSINNHKNGNRPRWYKGHKTLVSSRLCENCGHQWRIK